MKRLIAILLAMLICISLAACGNSDDSDETKKKDQTQSSVKNDGENNDLEEDKQESDEEKDEENEEEILATIEIPGKAILKFTGYEIFSDDEELRIAFLVNFMCNSDEESYCLNDLLNMTTGVVHFRQNGERLAAKNVSSYTDVTTGAGHKLEKGWSINTGKGFQLIDRESPIEIVLVDDDGNVIESHTILITD